MEELLWRAKELGFDEFMWEPGREEVTLFLRGEPFGCSEFISRTKIAYLFDDLYSYCRENEQGVGYRIKP